MHTTTLMLLQGPTHAGLPTTVEGSILAIAQTMPFIGTSIARDSQLLVLRLFYSSLDFPVKHFVVVVPERAMNPPHGGMWHELEHLKDYANNVVILTCAHPPSVAEGWNAGGCA
jgi:hypothetical protein